MAKNFQITEEMKSQIGWTSKPWTYEVSRSSVRAFARGVGYTDLVYFDVNTAKKAGYRDLPAPPTYLGTAIFIPGKSDDNLPRDPETSPKIDHGLKGMLDGSTETEYLEQICAGDTLTCITTLTDMTTKGSIVLGTTLVISTESTFSNQDGKVMAIQRKQIIFY
ncbi:MaoC family dehydratase N-terminal domain-containing protein [bacterium]|nr:MaoC family dehydratase N-terminal domain-containing protein [bacterium]